ncbi:MAG: helix-turn-helix domain-containing protein [Dehalococcoidales bacterium]|nr:helix-turn-helix domain-containing protein [Dehalococcoidales bacterium]
MVEKFYSVDQIAKMIEMHPKTVQRYIREGRLKAQKIGKAWRVTGHDLSTFVEGTEGTGTSDASPGLQAILGAAGKSIKVSSIIDIPVKNSSEAVQIMNWITSSMNSRSSEYGHTSMTSQFIEPEHIIRIMLWGSPSFMEAVMNYLSEFGKE